MNSIAALIATVCVCSVVVSALGVISPKGVTSKTLSLVIGVFIICVMLVPIKDFVSGFKADIKIPEISESLNRDAQRSYKEAVIAETKTRLEKSILSKLITDGYDVVSVEVNLSENKSEGIYIKGIYIYITKSEKQIQRIIRSVEEDVKITPGVIVRQ